jgi:hypothetical protein
VVHDEGNCVPRVPGKILPHCQSDRFIVVDAVETSHANIDTRDCLPEAVPTAEPESENLKARMWATSYSDVCDVTVGGT